MQLVEDGFLSLDAAAVARGETPLELAPWTRFLALDRTGLYWSRAQVGTLGTAKAPEAQFVLLETDTGYRVLLPLISGDLRATLHGTGDGWTLRWDGAAPGAEPSPAVLLYAASGRDLFELLPRAIREVQAKLGTFRLREEKAVPPFCDDLFWCTWDAFYRDVSAAGVEAGLTSLVGDGVPLAGMILDDGWLNADGDLLVDLGTEPTKFPEGLAPLVQRAKRDHGLRWFGIWHAIPGYWAGLKADGPLARRFPTMENAGNIRPWQENASELRLVHPDAMAEFYGHWHGWLLDQGIDMVKIDGQSSLEVFCRGKLGRVSTMRATQEALQTSVHERFGGNLIHCMSHGSDVIYHLRDTLVVRSSDDYYPFRDEGHGRHLWWNATASLWLCEIALPDWDMFWSGHATGVFHAASRAISGGPIYFSDPPGKADAALLRRLALPDGRVLRPDRPALPTADGVFRDPTADPVLLRLTNRCGPVSVVAAFNCRFGGGPVAGVLAASDVHDAPANAETAYRVSDGSLRDSVSVEIELDSYGWEIVQFAPRLGGWLIPIGLEGMLLPAAVFGAWGTDGESVEVAVRAGGRVTFGSDLAARATLDGIEVVTEHRKGRLHVECPAAGTLRLAPR